MVVHVFSMLMIFPWSWRFMHVHGGSCGSCVFRTCSCFKWFMLLPCSWWFMLLPRSLRFMFFFSMVMVVHGFHGHGGSCVWNMWFGFFLLYSRSWFYHAPWGSFCLYTSMVVHVFKHSYGGSCACVFHSYHVHAGLFLFCEPAHVVTMCMVVHVFTMFMVVHVFTMFMLVHVCVVNHVHVVSLMFSWHFMLFMVMAVHAVHGHGVSCCSWSSRFMLFMAMAVSCLL